MRWQHSLAYVISRTLGPLPLICLVWLVTAVKSGIGFWKAIWVYPLIFLVSIAIPITITTYLVASGRVRDLDWSSLEDRNKYLPPIALSATGILTLLAFLLTNQTTFHLSLLLGAIILSEVFISSVFHFKISTHVSLATIAFAAVNLYFHNHFLWLFLLLVPIIWARYTLKVHTLAQLAAGLALTSGIILLATLLFGMPSVP